MEHLGGLIHRMPQTAFAVPGRLRRDLGAAAAQRLRVRMAHVPGDPAEPAAAALGPQADRAGGRRAARALGRAGGGLLRQGLRRDVPRPPAHQLLPSAPSRPTASRSPRWSSWPRSASSLASCPASSWMRSRPQSQALSGERCRRRPACNGSRSCRSRRAAAPTTGCSSSCSSLSRRRSRLRAIHRFASRPAAARAALGLRLSRRQPGDAIHSRQLRAADPARVRHRRVPRPRARRDAAARRHPPGAVQGRSA